MILKSTGLNHHRYGDLRIINVEFIGFSGLMLIIIISWFISRFIYGFYIWLMVNKQQLMDIKQLMDIYFISRITVV